MQMELQTDVSVDNTVMISGSTLLSKSPSLERQPEVIRKRQILLILISTLLILCLINFIFVIYLYTINDSFQEQPPNSSSQLLSVLLCIFYYAFGLLVTYRYYQTGLLIFSWLGFVSLLLILAVLMVILIGIIITTTHIGFVKGIIVGIIFVIICLSASLLQIFTVRYAFTLSKLLKNTKRLTIEQV